MSLIRALAYVAIVKRSLLPILPLLALALMGNSCEFKASVNNPPPPPPDGEDRTDRSGLLIVIRSGDPIELPGAQPADSVDDLVAAAFSVSVLSSPAHAEREPRDSPNADVVEDWPEPQAASTTARHLESPAAAIPEPGGLLLFAAGLFSTAGRYRSASTSLLVLTPDS